MVALKPYVEDVLSLLRNVHFSTAGEQQNKTEHNRTIQNTTKTKQNKIKINKNLKNKTTKNVNKNKM